MSRESRSIERARIRRSDGFTLLELLLAVTMTTILVVVVLQVFQVSLFAREEVRALSEPMTTGPRILDMIEDDINAMWTFNVKDNRVFKGENRNFVGDEADRIHLLVTGTTVHEVRLPDDTFRSATVAEVSYLVKGNNDNALHLELWRREDPMLDNELYRGGYYQLLSNRVRSFNVTYYEELGQDAEPFDDWDAAERGTLPRRIKIEMEIERSKESFNKLREVEDIGERIDKFVRHVVLSPQTVSILSPGIALVPVVPDGPPKAEEAMAGGGGGQLSGTSRGGGDQAGGGRGAGRGGNRGANTQNPIPNPGRGGNNRGGVNFDQILRDLGNGARRGGGGGGNRDTGGGGAGGGGNNRR